MRKLGILLAFAILLRLLFVFVVAPAIGITQSLVIDSDGYLETAKAIQEGNYFFTNSVISTRRMFLYPLLIAFLTYLPFPILPMLQVWHILLDGCTLLAVYGFCRLLYSERAALWAGFLYAVYPLALYRLALLNTEVIQTATVAVFLLGAVHVLRQPTAVRALLLSCVGILVLCINPAFVLFPGFLAIRFFFSFPPRRALALGLCLVLPIAAFTLLWGARNAYVTGSFFFFDTRGGKEFWIGNHQSVEGRWEGPYRHIWEQELAQHMETMRQQGLGASDYNAYFYKLSFQEIRGHPGGAVILCVKKFFRFWYIPASETMIRITIPLQSAYLLLAAAGCWAQKRGVRGSLIPLAVIAYFCTIYTLSYSCIRFSHSVMPWVCALGGNGAAVLVSRWSEKKGWTPGND